MPLSIKIAALLIVFPFLLAYSIRMWAEGKASLTSKTIQQLIYTVVIGLIIFL